MLMSALYSFFDPLYLPNGLSDHSDTYVLSVQFLRSFQGCVRFYIEHT